MSGKNPYFMTNMVVATKDLPLYFKDGTQGINPFGADTGIFHRDKVNAMFADDLGMPGAGSSAAIVLTM